jgi:hypothetical protein
MLYPSVLGYYTMKRDILLCPASWYTGKDSKIWKITKKKAEILKKTAKTW